MSDTSYEVGQLVRVTYANGTSFEGKVKTASLGSIQVAVGADTKLVMLSTSEIEILEEKAEIEPKAEIIVESTTIKPDIEEENKVEPIEATDPEIKLYDFIVKHHLQLGIKEEETNFFDKPLSELGVKAFKVILKAWDDGFYSAKPNTALVSLRVIVNQYNEEVIPTEEIKATVKEKEVVVPENKEGLFDSVESYKTIDTFVKKLGGPEAFNIDFKTKGIKLNEHQKAKFEEIKVECKLGIYPDLISIGVELTKLVNSIVEALPKKETIIEKNKPVDLKPIDSEKEKSPSSESSLFSRISENVTEEGLLEIQKVLTENSTKIISKKKRVEVELFALKGERLFLKSEDGSVYYCDKNKVEDIFFIAEELL